MVVIILKITSNVLVFKDDIKVFVCAGHQGLTPIILAAQEADLDLEDHGSKAA
jgi:hypothetical protein